MLIGKIIRPIWSTRKSEKLEGIRLLEAEIMPWGDWKKGGSGKFVIAADNIGAGIGEYVFLTFGSAVRNVVFNETAPFKMVVTAIIDKMHVDSLIAGQKNEFIMQKEA